MIVESTHSSLGNNMYPIANPDLPTTLISSSDDYRSSNTTATPPTWMYRYNVANDPDTARGFGVPHGAQGAASFGAAYTDAPASYSTYNAPIVPIGMHYYASFVRALDPNVYRADVAPAWTEWTDDARQRLVFELDRMRMESVPEDERKRCRAWEGVAEAARQKRGVFA